MTIDDKLEGEQPVKSSKAKCYFNGEYQYRTKDKSNSKMYCCLSDNTCCYYKKGVSNEDLCTAYKPSER